MNSSTRLAMAESSPAIHTSWNSVQGIVYYLYYWKETLFLTLQRDLYSLKANVSQNETFGGIWFVKHL